MNDYVLKLYDLISEKNPSFGRDISVNDFVNTIGTNDEYASQVYGYISELEPRFATSITQDDFMSALKKKRCSCGKFYGVSLSARGRRYRIGITIQR